jgi:hypothetical protein
MTRAWIILGIALLLSGIVGWQIVARWAETSYCYLDLRGDSDQIGRSRDAMWNECLERHWRFLL